MVSYTNSPIVDIVFWHVFNHGQNNIGVHKKITIYHHNKSHAPAFSEKSSSHHFHKLSLLYRSLKDRQSSHEQLILPRHGRAKIAAKPSRSFPEIREVSLLCRSFERDRLVEETEAHILVGLLLLCLNMLTRVSFG